MTRARLSPIDAPRRPTSRPPAVVGPTRPLPAMDGATFERPQSKGTNFLHVRSYVAQHVGPAAWRALVGSFDPEERAVLESLVPIGWYPLELDIALLRRADAMFGRGDLGLMEKMGRHSAESDLSGIQRMFLRVGSPAMILEKSRDYWSRFHNTGYWTVERLHPRAAVGTLSGWACVDEAACKHLGAYIVRMFELVGAKRARFEHDLCRCRGHADCVFTGEWTD